MAGLIDDDYSAWSALGGAAKGFAQGMLAAEDRAERREDKRMKQLEFEAKMRADQTAREQKAQEEQYKKSKDNFDRAGKLRDDHLKNPTTKNSQIIRESFDKVRTAGAQPSAAGDMSLIFAYMKMLDPGSTVREGEFANAQNAAGVPDQVRNMANRLMTGERLNPAQRKDFINQAARLYGAQQKSQAQFDEQFGGLADTYGIPRNEVVLKIFEDPVTGEQKQVAVPAQQGLMAQPQGILNQQKPRGLVGSQPVSQEQKEKARLEELRRKAAGQ